MPRARSHAENRRHCCAGCGRGGAKLEVTAVIETLIRKYAHADYDKTVNSYPSGICSTCKRSLYKCRTQEEKEDTVTPRSEWSSFELSLIKVPRNSDGIAECTCPMCKCGHYNPISVCGDQKMTLKPVVNVTGEKMDCEDQPRIGPRASGKFEDCPLCHQVTYIISLIEIMLCSGYW